MATAAVMLDQQGRLAAQRIDVQYRAIGITPEGLGAMLLDTPSLLPAWPMAVRSRAPRCVAMRVTAAS